MPAEVDHHVVLKIALLTPNPDGGFGLPVLFWGAPGTAKSATIADRGRWMGDVPVKVLSPSEHGDGAFGCTPVPWSPVTAKGTIARASDLRIVYPSPGYVDELEDAPASILFIDELNTPAHAHLFGPMLALIHARRIAGKPLPKTMRVLGAANPVESAAGGLELPLAIANRMGHFAWGLPDKRAWNNFLVSGAGALEDPIDLAAEEARVMRAWPAAYTEAAAIIAAFTDARRALWLKEPNVRDSNSTEAWCSPRSWHLAAHAMAGAKVHGFAAHIDGMVSGFVGEAAATELAAYRHTLDLPNAEQVLDGLVKWKHNTQRLDVTYAVVSTCAAVVVADTDVQRKHARAAKLWSILAEVCATDPDLAYDPATVLVKAHGDLSRATGVLQVASTPVLNIIHKVALGGL